jgi:hypothetical protein
MKRFKKVFFVGLLIAVTFVSSSTTKVWAQTGLSGIAYDVIISDADAVEGTIVTFDGDIFSLSTQTYDANVVGVVTENPVVAFRNPSVSEAVPIISTGSINVWVNAENGLILVNDRVTTSSTKGEAMKADAGGFVIGNALEPYDSEIDGERKLILVNFNPYFYGQPEGEESEESETEELGFLQRLSDLFSLNIEAAAESPSTAFKQTIASMVLLLSMVFAFFTFGRLAKNGIEAFGRNPLAARLIGLGMAMNVLIAIAIVAAGVIVAILILRV